MSVNSTSNSSLNAQLDYCFDSRMSIFISTFSAFINVILLLPLFILVLYFGYQRWRKQCSVTTAAKMSHSDIFTFNMVALEMFGILGSTTRCYGTYTDQKTVLAVGGIIYSLISPGQTLLHLLTCVERYLAVVHPVTYMGLRQSGGVRIRNISIVCVWLFCFATLGLANINPYFDMMYTFLYLVISSVVVTFCSLSVLCVLIRPGPGEVGGNRKRVDQSKQRAFYTITVIMGALLLRFLSSLVSIATYYSQGLSINDKCLVGAAALCFNLPSSLVLPLLFLYRAGKLPGCKHNTASG